MAAASSSTGMPRSLASRFMVPNGRMPSGVSVSASTCAAHATVPSPPATTTMALPAWWARRTRSGRVPASCGTNSGRNPAAAKACRKASAASARASKAPAAPFTTTWTGRSAASGAVSGGVAMAAGMAS